MELGTKYQWVLISQKERQLDIMCIFLMEDHNATYQKVFPKKKKIERIEPKSDHMSRSNYQFIGNPKHTRTCQITTWTCYQQNPGYGKLYKANNFCSSTNK